MPLATGSRLGPYEIVAPLGAGGMGEVYKAKDTRLDRLVAIKVLPSHLAERPDLRQRFEREAKAISSLQHPNICALFDVGHDAGVDFLVMEYLEGETLAERLTRGALPPDQALRCGIEIAAALDKAHRQGIVHRDLKPGNVMLTRGGAKVLDFGLAKVAAGPGIGAAMDALTSLPTEAAGAAPLTTEGTLLGTFQYMAPEQLEGTEADARSDIFALGSILYEMAAGRPAFQGKSRASLISQIMSAEPASIASIQPLAPPALDRVIRTCLAKDPDARIQTAHDVVLQLQWIAEGGSQAGVPAPVAARRKGRERLAWTIAGAAAAVALALGVLAARSGGPPPETTRLQVTLPRALAQLGSPRISPDGRFIAFDGFDSTGRNMVWVRPMGSLTAEPIPSTEGLVARPFWSPDSRFIGFVAAGKLKKVSVTGGPAQTICEAPSGWDGSWSSKGVIAFDGGNTDPIRRVSAAGGAATTAVSTDSGAVGWPLFLPDGHHMIYLRIGTAGANEIWVADIESGKRRRLGPGSSRVDYSPDGYLLFVKDGSLVAQAFDIGGMKLMGEPMPIVDGVSAGGNGLAHFSVSHTGSLVYSIANSSANSQLAWVDRAGKILSTVGPEADIVNITLSPDGKRVAARILDEHTGNRDIWILDPARGTSTRFTFDPGTDNVPLWSSDGGSIVFSSDRKNGVSSLYVKPATGTGAETPLFASTTGTFASGMSRDGQWLLYMQLDPKTGRDVWALPLFGDRKPIPFLNTPASEGQARFAPDGKHVAYACDESGQYEIYVQEFPGPGGKWQISARGGFQPTWRADGKELYYLALDGRLMAVPISTEGGFAAGVPAPLFNTRLQLSSAMSEYAPSADGQRFLVVWRGAGGVLEPLTVVEHWDAELKRR